MRAPFRSNPAYSEDLQYVSGLGTTVRTKSELNIVNALEAAGIPYRYEMETMVLGKAIYPDFTIKKADGRKVIWEHYGMTHDEDYAKKAEIRSINYEKSGYRRHTNFIVTYESDIKDRQEIDKIIRRFILF